MQCILYKIYFWKGFPYVLQNDMHLICAPMLTKFYSCKKWVLQYVPKTLVVTVDLTSMSNMIVSPYLKSMYHCG
jgi:hypothetical protein